MKLFEKTKLPFCKFIMRLDGKYYSKINPTFDTLYKLLMAVCEPESSALAPEEVGRAVLSIA